MFFDEARILVRSGAGGDGMISFRREKFVPRGGPDGGDGGDGGSVIFAVEPRLNSLTPFHRQTQFKAEDGRHGGRKKQTGASGKDLRLSVPPGTLIRDAESGALLADLTLPDEAYMALPGGRGGRGNVHFASSTNQTPTTAERGEPGREQWLTLELKLIADVGLVGLPNAGKSTLLAAVSAARPKIAAYPFTTLTPNLGVVTVNEDQAMVWADIPGLIEGASAGVGLGHAFLRHIERTRVVLHLLDGSAREPLENYAIINQELALYDAELEKRPQLVVLTKMDLPDAVAWEPLIAEEMARRGVPFHAISAVSGHGLRELLFKTLRMVQEAPDPADSQAEEDLIVIRPERSEDTFDISREPDGSWRVSGAKIERVAAMTYWEFDAPVQRFQRILDQMGITAALEEAGVGPGDTVRIGKEELEWGAY